MIEVAQEARLVEKSWTFFALHRRKEALERDLLDLAVAARQFSAMHGRHAACAELLVDDRTSHSVPADDPLRVL